MEERVKTVRGLACIVLLVGAIVALLAMYNMWERTVVIILLRVMHLFATIALVCDVYLRDARRFGARIVWWLLIYVAMWGI